MTHKVSPVPQTNAQPEAVIYLRVSTKEQAQRGGEAEGFSIPAQREACLRKADALGVRVVAEFVDAGESARSANRPDLQRMLAYAAEHRVRYVIVHKVDRLARNRVDDVEITVALTAAGAQLVSCTENIDETPSGMLLHGIMSSIAEFYSRNLATETRKGLRQKALGGGTPGMAPFGYVNTRRRTDEGREVRTVELDPERATWVPWLFERYATGEWTTAMLRDELEQQDVTSLQRPNRPARPLGTSHVANILQNRYYLGYVKFEGVEYPGRHDALISEGLFERVQAVRLARHQSKEKPRVHTHYLKGSVYCGECGEGLSIEVSRSRLGNLYHYFYCLGRQAHKNGCQFKATQVHVVEELVENHWGSVSLTEHRAAEIRDLVRAHIEDMAPVQAQERQQAEATLAQLQRQSDKLLQAHYADAIPIDTLKREQHRIALARASAEVVLQQSELDTMRLRRSLESACRLLVEPQTHYLDSDDNARRDLNQAVFEKIYIVDDEVAGSDLTPAFRQLLSEDLAGELLTERARTSRSGERRGHLRSVGGEGRWQAKAGDVDRRDLPPRRKHSRRVVALADYLDLERPGGHLPWERKNPGPLQDRGSNESILVAGAGFEPATSGL